MTRKERMETLGHPATRFTNIYVKNFGDANLSDDEFQGVSLVTYIISWGPISVVYELSQTLLQHITFEVALLTINEIYLIK